MVTPSATPQARSLTEVGAAGEQAGAHEPAKARYRALLEQVPAITYVVTVRGKQSRLYISPQSDHLLGGLLSEWRHDPSVWMTRLHPGDRERVLCAVGRGLRTLEPLSLEYRLVAPDGRCLWIRDAAAFVREANGTVVLQGVLIDITDRKAAEAALVESERRYRRLAGLSGGIAEQGLGTPMNADLVSFATDQLRPPLAGIRRFLELAARNPALPGDARESIDNARQSAERLIALVNDLVAASRLESGTIQATPEPIVIAEMTEQVLSELAPEIADKRLRVTVTDTRGSAPVEVDPQLLRRALVNLVGNAVKFTPFHGDIAIRMSRDDGAFRWEVQDSGIGIRREDQPRLFEKFFRVEDALSPASEGAGLGLYMVRLIVDLLGGDVWCESDAGRGALFGVTLPAHAV